MKYVDPIMSSGKTFIDENFKNKGYILGRLCYKLLFAGNNSYSHNEREVLIPPPPIYSPVTGYSKLSPII